MRDLKRLLSISINYKKNKYKLNKAGLLFYLFFHNVLMLRIKDIPTCGPDSRDKDEKVSQTDKLLKKLYKLQSILMAQKKYAVLVIFQ